jgi:hypothetical protein
MQRDSRALIAAVLLFVAAVVAVRSWPMPRPTAAQAGNFGYTPNPEGSRQFLRELRQPYFSDAGAEILDNAQGRDTFLWRYADRAHRQVYGKPYGPWKQGIGDCVSFGFALSAYVGQAVDFCEGELPEPPLLVATEPLYGGSRCESRGIEFAGWQDGSYGAAAARWVAGLKNGTGGIIYRKKYGTNDLTEYDPQRAKDWGAYGCGGRGNTELDHVANEHTVRAVALVTNWQEAAASIEAGAPVAVCCGVGFSSRRNKDGFSERIYPGWAHCQAMIAVRYAHNEGGRDGILVMNSWGVWNGPPENKWPKDQPDGSYWVSRETVNEMLKGGDSFSLAGVNGFRWRELNHGDFLAVPPDTDGSK